MEAREAPPSEASGREVQYRTTPRQLDNKNKRGAHCAGHRKTRAWQYGSVTWSLLEVGHVIVKF